MNQADMNQTVRENLSAGIDGELPKEELRFLVRRLGHDASLQQAWARYHIARDGLRRQLPSFASPEFASRVMLAIEQESMPATTGRRSHWLRWSAGGAIAASVAAVALMITQPAGDAERAVAVAAHGTRATVTGQRQAPMAASIPAAVPPWLSGNSAGLLSQQAAATRGEDQAVYPRDLSAYPPLPRYRMLNNHDGSYLLLLNPQQKAIPDMSQQATAVAQ
ncbi:MAG: sigma-E factor negative regulatory protein [Xanthomonadaceae bacterium]|nr:sigma-E factor negative regulatory protein [Xanthomonadaceae bacterium]MDE3072591.1 sigma-E factor negative regulatory protein [Pseudomonadota bacterium]